MNTGVEEGSARSPQVSGTSPRPKVVMQHLAPGTSHAVPFILLFMCGQAIS